MSQNQHKYFDFKTEIIEKRKINLDESYGTICIVTERNTGKSYSTISYAIDDVIKCNKLIAFMRTTRMEADKMSEALVKIYEKHANKKIVVTNKNEVYLIEYENDEQDHVVVKNKILIGFIVCLVSSQATKSTFDHEFKYVIYDEFNDVKERIDIYENYVNTIGTIKRNNENFWCILLGNKDSQNNTFLVNWGIRFNNIPKDIVWLDLYDKIGVYYIEYPHGYYAGINLVDDMISKLASVNDEMNRFINLGGYRKTKYDNIINYNIWIKPTAKPKYYLMYRHHCYECGYFDDDFKNIKNCMYLHEVEFNQRTLPLPSYSFNEAYGFGHDNQATLDDEDLYDFAETLNDYALNKKLYFSSFNTYIITTQEIYIILKYMKTIK